MRNHLLYELIYYKKNKMLFHKRDSFTLLMSSLNKLAKNLYLGSKGLISSKEVQLSNLQNHKEELLHYMKQDSLLLCGVIQKVQDIYQTQYKVDIVTKLTLSSLALTIFHRKIKKTGLSISQIIMKTLSFIMVNMVAMLILISQIGQIYTIMT